MRVPSFNLAAAHDELRPAIEQAIERVLASGHYILGPEVEAFEREFAEYVESDYCVGVGSGLDALHLALRAVGVGPGDEVIVPSNTFIATWLAVDMCGATPVPVEVHPATFNLDPERLDDAVTPRTRAIVPVHLYGQPADLTAIGEWAARFDLRIVDDAAQAHGARWDGRRVGGLADASAWSFYPVKNLGALGDGGAVTTNSPEIAARVSRLRNYGTVAKYANAERGYNTRLDEMQAAILRVKLPLLDAWNARRATVAAAYLRGLADTSLILPTIAPEAESVWHLFVVRSDRRDALAERLAERGIGTSVHYPTPPHLQPAYADRGWSAGEFPISEQMHATVLSLPMSPHLSAGDVDFVLEALLDLAG